MHDLVSSLTFLNEHVLNTLFQSLDDLGFFIVCQSYIEQNIQQAVALVGQVRSLSSHTLFFSKNLIWVRLIVVDIISLVLKDIPDTLFIFLI